MCKACRKLLVNADVLGRDAREEAVAGEFATVIGRRPGSDLALATPITSLKVEMFFFRLVTDSRS